MAWRPRPQTDGGDRPHGDSADKGQPSRHPVPTPGIPRRHFLKSGTLGGLALLAGGGRTGARTAAAAEPPRVRQIVTLGRTGLRVPDIGFGGSSLAGDEAVVRHALDRGITHFDTAESYTGGESERTLGKALRGERDRITLLSKTAAGVGSRPEQLMSTLEASLQRLQTDYLDVYLNHAVNDPRRLQQSGWAEFVDRAVAQGKIRFAGMSGHGGRLVECIELAMEQDWLDVLLVAHNFGQDPAFYERFMRRFDFVATQPELPRVLLAARAAGIGVFAMKTLRGGRLNDLSSYESEGTSFAQAALRWVLAGPYVDAAVITMQSAAQADEYLGASGFGAPSQVGIDLLARYETAQGQIQCRYGCDACAASCPHGVQISEVLRTRMYAEDYRELSQAREAYRALQPDADACTRCSGAPCAGACPFGIPIAALTQRTHRRLAL